jgi:hypothetical protein
LPFTSIVIAIAAWQSTSIRHCERSVAIQKNVNIQLDHHASLVMTDHHLSF